MEIRTAFEYFGSYVPFQADGSEYVGQLMKIAMSDDGTVELTFDMDDTLKSFPYNKVHFDKTESNQYERLDALIGEIRDNIDAFSLTLDTYHQEECDQLVSKIKDAPSVFKVKTCLYSSASRQMYKEAAEVIKKSTLNESEKALLQGVIAYKCRVYNEAYRIFGAAWLKEQNNPKACMNLYLTAEAMRNHVLCFYLLKQMFRRREIWQGGAVPTNMLWYRFTFYCTKYGDFSYFTDLNDYTRRNIVNITKAYIYIFYAYNMKKICGNLTAFLTDSFNAAAPSFELEDIARTLRFYKSFLPEQSESYYKRAEYCIQHILEHTAQNEPSADTRICGFIYEYIPNKKSGYILGWDLQNYRYMESDLTDDLLERLKDNIASKIEVRKEDLILVSFEKHSTGEKRNAGEIRFELF